MTAHSIITLSDTTPTLVSPAGTHSGLDITIQNISESGYAYVGGSGVTTEDYGFRIAPNSAVAFELPGHDALFVIGSTSSVRVAIITTGLEVGD